jgi:ABC-type transporter Mla MlaB component
MDMYQHDSAARFQFILRGELSGNQVPDLEHAWTTAQSIVKTKEVVLDVSGITRADPSGMELLHRMQDSGVQVTAALPAESEKLLKSLSIPVETPRGQGGGTWVTRLLRSVRVSVPRRQ